MAKQKKMAVVCCCTLVFLSGCADQSTGAEKTDSFVQKEMYSINGQDIQISLPEEFVCTEESGDQIIFEGQDGKVMISYLEEPEIRSEKMPDTEEECVELHEDVIGNYQYQVDDFQVYPDEGTYQTTVRYQEEDQQKYFIAAGNFDIDNGYVITSVISSGTMERMEEIQNAVYNVKIFRN